MNLLVILYDPLGHVLTYQAEKQPKGRQWHFFLEKFMKSFKVKIQLKRYKVL